jgi:hypothetical protein
LSFSFFVFRNCLWCKVNKSQLDALHKLEFPELLTLAYSKNENYLIYQFMEHYLEQFYVTWDVEK